MLTKLAIGLVALSLLYFFGWMTLAISWKITMVQKTLDRREKQEGDLQ